MGSRVLVLDFGSQYNQLIIRRIRECGVFALLRPADIGIDEIKEFAPDAIVLSGGPSSVYDEGSPRPCEELWNLDLPMLGICYGMQVMMHMLGGEIQAASEREYGKATLCQPENSCDLLEGFEANDSQVWMSHGDSVSNIPAGFENVLSTPSTPYTIVQNPSAKRYGLQFHPEVVHTTHGKTMLENFLLKVCKLEADWKMENYIDRCIEQIRSDVGSDRVILGLSGGVDSSVMAALLAKAIGEQLTCVMVDNGLLRLNERQLVQECFEKNTDMKLVIADAEDLFLGNLKGVDEPEAKRKVIGKTFIEVFEKQVGEIGEVNWLAQGTIYPDVIESTSTHGRSQTIKSHHNVGGLPERMQLKVLEPLKELFKDEVRQLGRELGLPEEMVARHPFPGPGLGVRILGEVTKEACDILRQADHIYLEEIREHGLYDEIAQAFAVFLPVKSVGVMGDGRTYENVLALRAVTTTDFMTADWYRFPPDILAKISNRIVGEVRGINRVVYDITSKPPGTIEWE